MRTILFIAAIISAGFFSSCKKYLDIKPKGYTIPTTMDDFDRLLNAPILTSVMSTDIEMLTDDLFLKGAVKDPLLDNTAGRAYIWAPTIFGSGELNYSDPWIIMYRNIFQYNAVIQQIDASTYGTEVGKKQIKAQAKAGRALCYWYLANFYCKPYTAAGAATDAGVPLVSNTDISAPLPARGTLQQVYDFILKDLLEAIPDLPTSTVTKFRETKVSGYALLARTYLYLGNYEKSRQAANDALATNSGLINYNTIVTAGAPGQYTLSSGTVLAPEARERNPENLLIKLFTSSYGIQGQSLSTGMLNMLPNADLRRVAITFDKEQKLYQYQLLTYINIGLSVPELYLIRAETAARQNDLTSALQDINKLRQNRIAAERFAPLASADKKQVIQWALDEKRREFFGKGMRWFEVRRLSADPDFAFTIHHYFDDGSSIALEPGNKRFLLSIPEKALNQNITQNP